MSKWKHISDKYLWLLPVLLAAVLLLVSILTGRDTDYTAIAARRTSAKIEARITMLEDYMRTVAAGEKGTWPQLEDFPEDMVVYRYEQDSLRSWCNQFTLDNDDISRRPYMQRLGNLRFNVVSPLLDVDTTLSYVNMGPKWYLVKGMAGHSGVWVIGGLEIKNTASGNVSNGVNPKFGLSDRFVINPISYSGGVPIRVEGKPLMKILLESPSTMPLLPGPLASWVALFLLISGGIIFLLRHPSRKVLVAVMLIQTIILGLFYTMGHSLKNVSDLFSPTIYADGQMLYSLGAAMIIGLWLVTMVTSLYIARQTLLRMALQSRLRQAVYAFAIVASIVGISLYIHLTFKSIILNSNIVLQLYRITAISRFSVYVYLVYLGLLISLALLLGMLFPLLKRWWGIKPDIASMSFKVLFSAAVAVYLVWFSTSLSFGREESRVGIWANRLAIDRELGLELRLRSVERAIASDPVIPTIMAYGRDYRIILDRIKENYLSRISQDYDITMYMYGEDDKLDRGLYNYFSSRLRAGVPIADSSHFSYARSSAGRAQYTGLFVYYTSSLGATNLLLGIESKADKVGRGYSTLLGNSGPGSVVVPQRYSYGKYLEGKLVSYQGDYAYPTVLSGPLLASNEGSSESGLLSGDRFIHFVTEISEDETVVISRHDEDFTRYLMAGLMIALVAFLEISLCTRRPGRKSFDRNYYKTRIKTVLYLSLIGTLVIMALISVLFVYRRNESNIMNMMTGKIGTIQSLVEASGRYFTDPSDFTSQEFSGALEDIASYTKSDISLYTTDGRVFKSTYPAAFERMLLGSRLDENAYQSIMYRNLRYYIHKEKFASHTFYSMYAPVFNDNGRMLAILSAPYTDSGLYFRSEAIFHSVFVITVFLLLLLLTRWLTTKVVDKMFSPITDMGRKMSSARTEGLEYIIYDREDEISSLVRSYNLMVHDLSESSKQAAQVERDKAWSEMARQVAHEIKNPLTPIKLQIQRIIRLKAKNDPQWEEKFDSIVPVILESIDGLTDTANEFSTFARLYSEEPVEMDLDALLSDQVSLFDDKEDVAFHYIGLKGACISGPKPQLTRVFVNLLTNAVQAIRSSGTPDGEVVVSLRNSTREGYYDIVFEDNGPGVKDENRSRLFTPNFTTKTGGTGIGLAICKNILDRCGGDISYSRSFTLGGACFLIRYPMAKR